MARIVWDPLRPRGTPLHVVLVRPEIPHNTGAVGRLCVGLGCDLALVRPIGFALSDYYVRRAGLDYWPHLRLAIHDSWDDFLGRAEPGRMHFLSTKGGRSLYDTAFEPGDTLVFGSESAGLPESFHERYRGALVRIPMPGEHARSLNLANAVSVAVYEAYRQLLARGAAPGP
ncbi:MAG: tRNA (cytidine(34)-2'-O)-methyltransferase [Kiritimatiellae bacterium]|nr:tRNA (cytidine(34)-2'-O)-methyltransferase [Kiritimatiellia bacterium]